MNNKKQNKTNTYFRTKTEPNHNNNSIQANTGRNQTSNLQTRISLNMKNIRNLNYRNLKTDYRFQDRDCKNMREIFKNQSNYCFTSISQRNQRKICGHNNFLSTKTNGKENNKMQKNVVQVQTWKQSQQEQCNSYNVEKVRLLGIYRQGGNSTVYKGVIRGTKNMQVIIKKIQIDQDYKSRQQQINKILKSPYIVECLGTYHTFQPSSSPLTSSIMKQKSQHLNLILKKYNNNLDEILQLDNIQESRIKIYLYQMLRSLVYLHSMKICHRDIKPHNFVIKNHCICLCDFGAAKFMEGGQKGKRENGGKQKGKKGSVVYIYERPYRAPELLFGYEHYDEKVDLWAIGCVMAQMVLKKPIFNGANNLDQIVKILKVLGTPKWSSLSFCNGRIPKLPQIKGSGFDPVLGHKTDPLFIDLLSKLLKIEPNDRISALQALCEPYFDQIRDQCFYRNNLRLVNLPNFYYFTKRQISGKQQLMTKLIPYWVKQHCKRFQIKVKDYQF